MYVYPDGGVGSVPCVAWLGEVEIEADDLAMAGVGGREPSPERQHLVAYVVGRGAPVTAEEVAAALEITPDAARYHPSRVARVGQLQRVATSLIGADPARGRSLYAARERD